LDEIKEAEDSKSRDFQGAEAGEPIGRGTKNSQRQTNRKIARYTNQLEDGTITLREFLKKKTKSFYVVVRREKDNEAD
jgi:hypothetical protein